MPPPHCPVFLDESAYGRFVAWPDKKGWNASTHLARLDFGLGDEPAYVKLMYLDHWPALANEAIGWQMAHACGIPAPERAAVLTANASHWRDWLGTLPAGCPNAGDIAAWCSSLCALDDHHSWIAMSEDSAAAALFKSTLGRKIAAFDTWLHNPDRHPNNLLRLGNGGWAVIDHEMIFNGLLGNWRKPERDFATAPYPLARLDALAKSGKLTHSEADRIRSDMIHHADAHIQSIARGLPYLSDTLETIEPPQSQKSVLPLIVDRAWPFWMRGTLGTPI